jgi:AraC-like DNA-binding protein
LSRAARQIEVVRPEAVAHHGWLQRVGKYTAVPELIRHLGGDPVVSLIGAGLAIDALDDAERRVPYAALGRLLGDSAVHTHCPHFGLLVGRTWHIADLGLIGDLVRHSPTVGRALQTLVVYQPLNSEGGLAFLLQRGAYADLGYAIYHPGMYDAGQLYDAHLSAAFNFMRELCGAEWVPSEAFVPHARPATTVHYRNLLKVQPKFNAEFCALRFPAHWLQRPVEAADPKRLRDAQDRARDSADPHFIQQVYRALRMLLLEDQHSGDGVARMLSMHRRTLNRRLKALDLTFQDVLDQVRFDLARQFLLASEISLDDIAASLGYSGVSPFMRTFRRWAGTTPGRWRRIAVAQRAASGGGRAPHDSAPAREDEAERARAAHHPGARHPRHDDAAFRREQKPPARDAARLAEDGFGVA